MKMLNREKLAEVLTARAEGLRAEGKLACAEMVVNQCGERLTKIRIGEQRMNGGPLVERPVYRIASMTKPVTATAVLQQVEVGRIDLNAPVKEYLPEYEMMMLGHVEDGKVIYDRPAKEEIRVFHLLTHTSGIDVCPIHDEVMKYHPRKTLADTVKYYAKMPLAYEPFSTNGYSQSGAFDVAARIVELVSGESFEPYVKKHIFHPLGMRDTCFTPDADMWSRMVGLHNRNEDGSPREDTIPAGWVYENAPASCTLGGGGLASTVEDYSLFAEMLLLRGIGRNGVRIMSEETARMMSTPWTNEQNQPGMEKWGLGVRCIISEKYPRLLPVGTFGWSGAFGTHFWVDPVNQITAVYMRNSNYDSGGHGSIGAQYELDVMGCM